MMATLPFTIDSHLLQELGDRLVGRPHIALAELVKNAYDADANHCEIVVSEDEIEVWDDGHGMTFDEFRDFWMRIGTTNKVEQQVSRAYGRVLTGSKGIGRLAVQFLGRQVEIVTTSREAASRCVTASVDWDKAIEAGELTKAVAQYTMSRKGEKYAKGSRTGTKIVLRKLSHDWSEDDGGESPVRALARQVWMLQPPFADAVDEDDGGAEDFRIDLVSFDEEMEDAFRSQLAGVLDVWDSKIEGEIRNGRRTGRCDLVVTFRDGDRHEVATPFARGLIDRCEFEIRIFKLYGKQPGKISVEEARNYFREFGSVHVYDGGFRLPYYGIDHDWLGIESDHSHRHSVSKLLPKELNVPLAMHDLPTTERVFGVVRLNTARELRRANRTGLDRGRFLKINIGRDRLVDNHAYQELARVVRWSIHYYATRYQLRQERQVARLRPKEAPKPKLERLRETINAISPEVSPPLHRRLVSEVNDYYESVQNESKYIERQTALLAPLAAAGLAFLAFEHENNRQTRRLKGLVQQLLKLSRTEAEPGETKKLAAAFQEWMEQQQQTRSLFSPLMTEEDRENVRRLRAKATVRVALRNTRPLLRGLKAEVDGIPADLFLPFGTMADWQGMLQNILVNASNAMLDAPSKRVRVSGGHLGRRRSYLQVSDTGIGIEIEGSEGLFEPFKRRLEVSDERRSLGLAGTGLGLTIVRMICEMRNCAYEFVEPETGFATTFRMSWTRSEEST